MCNKKKEVGCFDPFCRSMSVAVAACDQVKTYRQDIVVMSSVSFMVNQRDNFIHLHLLLLRRRQLSQLFLSQCLKMVVNCLLYIVGAVIALKSKE